MDLGANPCEGSLRGDIQGGVAMVRLQDMKKINEFEWEIPKDFRQDMRVPVRVFATKQLLEAIMEDKSLEQAVNAATLPGLVGSVVVMPDMHHGYGFLIGGVG